MKVAIRDDDTCAFTPPEVLRRAYDGIWEYAPVSLAVVPFAVGYPRLHMPRERWYAGEPRPLASHRPLVEFVLEQHRKGRCGILLHGYTHEDFSAGFEFVASPDPDRRLREGRQYLEAVLDTRVSVFVPPHNALSRRGLAAVRAEGLNLLGSFLSFRPGLRPLEWRAAVNWWRVQRFRWQTGRSRRDAFVYPRVLRFGRHGEFGCHGLVPGTTARDLIRGLEEARRFGGDFCVATHHWELDDTMRGSLEELLAHAARYRDVRFVTADELFR